MALKDGDLCAFVRKGHPQYRSDGPILVEHHCSAYPDGTVDNPATGEVIFRPRPKERA